MSTNKRTIIRTRALCGAARHKCLRFSHVLMLWDIYYVVFILLFFFIRNVYITLERTLTRFKVSSLNEV